MIIPDVNLLVYAYCEGAPEHVPSRRWWEGLLNGQEGVGIPWSVTIGFIRIVSHPRLLERPVPAKEAIDCVKGWFLYTHVSPLIPGPEHLDFVEKLLTAAGAGGNLVPDSHIAALALEHNAEVHSNDSDFGRFSGLKWLNPLVRSSHTQEGVDS